MGTPGAPVGSSGPEVPPALAAVAAAAFTAAALGHLARPGTMARLARWRRSDWYQREIALFDLGHALGMARLARARGPNRLYVLVASVTALGLAGNHIAAIRAGDTGGALNVSAAVGDTVAGTVGLVLAARGGRTAPRSSNAGGDRAREAR